MRTIKPTHAIKTEDGDIIYSGDRLLYKSKLVGRAEDRKKRLKRLGLHISTKS